MKSKNKFIPLSFLTPASCWQRFTLIELLVVIAIIAVLAGILLPSLSSSKETTRTISCESNIKQLSIVYLCYSNDYNGYLPCLNNLGPGGRNRYGQTISAKNWLDDLVAQYLGSQQASVNPSMVLLCPSELKQEDITTNYGLNYLIATREVEGIQITSHHKPSMTGMLVENYGHLCYYCNAGNMSGKHAVGSAYATNRAVFFRHKGFTQCVAAFLDGHCERLERKRVPCRESYPEASEEALKNTIFNSGTVSDARDTITGL